MLKRAVLLCGSMLLFASVGTPQTSPATAPSAAVVSLGAPGGTLRISTRMPNIPSMLNAPYSGEQVGTMVQVLADGTRITRQQSSTKTWRDSQGRTRTERQMGMVRPNFPAPPTIVEIRDPVAGIGYILDVVAKTAYRVQLQPVPGMQQVRMQPPPAGPPPQKRVRSSIQTTRDGVETRMELLDPQIIDGISVEGSRTTTTYPVNFEGNDKPITVVRETWTSRELGTTILSKSFDPRQGESETKWLNLSRLEPDPTLFLPPADYKIVDEPGPEVTIRYGAQP